MKCRLLAVLVGIALVAAGCSNPGETDESTRDESGVIVEGGDVGVFVLEIGDCFDQPGSGDEVASVAAVPCEEPHDLQVGARFDIVGDGWPGLTAVQQDAAEGCLARFEELTGEPYETSPLDIAPLYPTERSWKAGDREVICALMNWDGSKLTGDLL